MSSNTSGLGEASDTFEKRNDYEGRCFIGVVVDNNDPEKRERVRCRIPHLYGPEIPDDMLPWIAPKKHRVRGGSAGVQSFSVPIVGAKLIIGLQDGDPYNPMYVGGLLTAEDVAEIFKTNYPFRYGIRDDYGNHLYVDTKTGDIDFLHKSGLNIHVTPAGTLSIDGPQDLLVHFARNVQAQIDGNVNAHVNGTVDVESDGVTNIRAPIINLN